MEKITTKTRSRQTTEKRSAPSRLALVFVVFFSFMVEVKDMKEHNEKYCLSGFPSFLYFRHKQKRGERNNETKPRKTKTVFFIWFFRKDGRLGVSFDPLFFHSLEEKETKERFPQARDHFSKG